MVKYHKSQTIVVFTIGWSQQTCKSVSLLANHGERIAEMNNLTNPFYS